MTTKTLNGFVHARHDAYSPAHSDWQIEGFELSVWKYEDMKSCGLFVIAPATITFELPDSWDPRKAMVEVLRKEQEKIRTEYLARVQQLEDEIGKYLAIGN